MAIPAEIVGSRWLGVEGERSAFGGEVQNFYEPCICPEPPAPPPPPPPVVLVGTNGISFAPIQISPAAVGLTGDVDIICLYDLDPYLSLVSSNACLAQDLVHGITTPQGGLFYDGSWGFDIRQQLNGPVTAGTLKQLSANIQWQFGLDQRVASSSNILSWDGVNTLTITSTVTPVSGTTFTFVVSATAVTVQLLQVS